MTNPSGLVSITASETLSAHALPAILAERLWGFDPLGRTVDRLEYGLVFTTVAGIMNLVVVVDAYETARREELGQSPSGASS